MKLKKIIKSIFFWKKKGDPEIPKAEEMIQLYLKYIPQLKKAFDFNDAPFNGDYFKRMYDFWAGYRDWNDNTEVNYNPDFPVAPVMLPNPWSVSEDKREEKTPLAVADELERIPLKVNVDDLDAKIDLFKSKSKLISQKFTKDQVEGFTQRLENRKHYAEHHEFFKMFPITNDEKIDDLLSRYKLVMKKSDLFVPTFPKAAIDIMTEYSIVVKKFTDEAPVFYVIAEKKDFEKKYKRLDPILLVQSPFGFYWQILGAWDKEMLLLSEL